MNRELNPVKVLKVLKTENLRSIPEFDEFWEVCEFTTEYMLKKFSLDHDSDINNGLCFIWAFIVWSLWSKPEEIKFLTSDGHVFLQVGSLYYDASFPSGNPDRDDVHDHEETREVTLGQMIWYWGQCGTHRFKFREMVNTVLPDLYKKAQRRFYKPAREPWEIHVFEIPKAL